MNEHKYANRLSQERSPYLLQHAHNPVDWFPWSEEAFTKAKAEDKPIFLSIGYSACHWCHVMAEESFEDEEVARILNKDFVAVKVDKEERPDLDMVYMMACQLFAGQGGWPTTLFLTPDKRPFFAGTYFPKESVNGRAGLIDILNSIKKSWSEKRKDIEDSGKDMVVRLNAINCDGQKLSGSDLTSAEDLIHKGIEQLQNSFDEINGGFGKSPKFPTPQNLLFLLAFNKAYKDGESLRMAEKTLIQMYRGGIYDHIGGGFSRYSTDSRWLVPHFEKMLYDNAMLAFVYTKAYRSTEDPIYKEVAESILGYVLREMTAPEGGFYSAQDADSQGEEGKYYVFSRAEILDRLGEKEGSAFCDAYDISPRGNFEGYSIPNLLYNFSFEDMSERFESQRKTLLTYRAERMSLHKDDKVLTAWNGMMIAAFANAGSVFGQRRYLDAAVNAEKFITEKLVKRDGRLKVRYREQEAAGDGYLDDYAYYVWGLLELYETTKKVGYLQKAIDLNTVILNDFSDEERGGFYFTSFNSEKLIWRPKESYDGAIPSGNSIAAWNMVRLANKMGSSDLTEKAEAQLRFLAVEAERYPIGHSLSLYLLTKYLNRDVKGARR
jgi:hypothetical protein